MTVAELVANLSPPGRRGGYLWPTRDGGIAFRGEPGALTEDLRAEIRRRRDEVLAWLRTDVRQLRPAELRALDCGPRLCYRDDRKTTRLLDRLEACGVTMVLQDDGDVGFAVRAGADLDAADTIVDLLADREDLVRCLQERAVVA